MDPSDRRRRLSQRLLKWVELPSGCVVPGSRVSLNFWLLSCKLLRGVVEVGPFQSLVYLGRSTMLGRYRACLIDRSEEQVGLQPSCCMKSSGCMFWLVHSCVQFVVSADWEAPGKWVPSPVGEIDEIDLAKFRKVG